MKYFLIGIGAGLAAGFAFAPASGKVTRKYVGCKVSDAQDCVGDFADQIGDLVRGGKRMIERQNRRAKKAYSALVA
jgi:gas vesicle protein